MRALVLGLSVIAAFAQQQPAPAEKMGTLEGRVVDALTGAPLRKTMLTLRPTGSGQGSVLTGPLQQVLGNAIGTSSSQARRQLSTITDNEGRYSFTVDQPGDFRIGADHTGYVRGEYGSRRPGAAGKTVAVGAAQRVSGIDIKLTPQGVIAGRVVDEDGDPVERAQVTVTTRLASNAGMLSSTAVTNDLGEFRLASLAAGKYYLMANRIGVILSEGDANQSGQETYAVTYFPGVTESASAATIAVAPGQQVTGIFIPLRKARVFRVTGVVSGSIGEDPEPANAGANARPGQPAQPQVRAAATNRVIVNLIERNETGRRSLQRTLNSRVMNPDGSFEVPNVPPGSYWAIAMSPLRGAVVVGRAPVEVRNGNVSNVVVPVAPPVAISGTARAEGGAALTLANARIVLLPLGESVPSANAQVQANGGFQIANAGRARYRVSAQGLPQGAYLKAVRVNGQDVTQAGLDLTSAPAVMNIELIFSAKAASIAGTVKLGAENVPGQALLVADPYVETEPAVAPVGVPIGVDSTGAFNVKNVPPGNYRLYAFEDVDFQTVDAAMLKRLEARSEKLALSESDAARVEVRQISAEDSSAEQ